MILIDRIKLSDEEMDDEAEDGVGIFRCIPVNLIDELMWQCELAHDFSLNTAWYFWSLLFVVKIWCHQLTTWSLCMVWSVLNLNCKIFLLKFYLISKLRIWSKNDCIRKLNTLSVVSHRVLYYDLCYISRTWMTNTVKQVHPIIGS